MFLHHLSSARITIECAFGRLKGIFGILRSEIHISQRHLPDLIYSFFVLHNFCELQREEVPVEYIQGAIAYEKEIQPPTARITSEMHTGESQGKNVGDIVTFFFNNH